MLLAIFFILQRYSFFDLNPPDWVASPAKVMNLVMNCQEEKSPVFYFPKFGNFTRFFGPAGWSKIQIRKNGLAKILRILPSASAGINSSQEFRWGSRRSSNGRPVGRILEGKIKGSFSQTSIIIENTLLGPENLSKQGEKHLFAETNTAQKVPR